MPTSASRVRSMSKEPNMAEVVAQGAARLSAGLTREVEKAAPADAEVADKPEAAKTEEVEKAQAPEQPEAKEGEPESAKQEEVRATEKALTEADVEAAVARAVEKALTPVLEKFGVLAEVEKSLAAIDDKVSSSLQHQAAATEVLVGFNEQQQATREVMKSVQAEVKSIGDQPAGRKSLDTAEVREVEKAATAEIDLTKLREVTKSMEVDKRITIQRFAKQGNVQAVADRLSHAQRREMGL